MGTRGRVVCKYKKKIYAQCNHMDSYPTGLGNSVVNDILYLIDTYGIDMVREMISSRTIVTDDMIPTQADCDACDTEWNEYIEWKDIFNSSEASLVSMITSSIVYDEDPCDYQYSYIVDWDKQVLTEEWTELSIPFDSLYERFFTKEYDNIERVQCKRQMKIEQEKINYVKHILSIVESTPQLHDHFISAMQRSLIEHLETQEDIEIIPSGTYAYMYSLDGEFISYRKTRCDHRVITLEYFSPIDEVDSLYIIRVNTEGDIKLYFPEGMLDKEFSDEQIERYTLFLSRARERSWKIHMERTDECVRSLTYRGTSLYPHKEYRGYDEIDEYFKSISKHPNSYIKEFLSYEKL